MKKIANVFRIGNKCVLTDCECGALTCHLCNVPSWDVTVKSHARKISNPPTIEIPEVVLKVEPVLVTEPVAKETIEAIVAEKKPEKKSKKTVATENLVDDLVATKE